MPLDEREQRILEEIEAQFYQEDPAFAQTVRDTTLASFIGKKVRWAIVGLVVGLALMLFFLPRNQFVALGAFILMVGSSVWIVTALTRRRSSDEERDSWLSGLRQRWQKDS